jgi:hypothetical protein
LRIRRIDRQRDEVIAALRDLVGIVDEREVSAGVIAAIKGSGVVPFGFYVGVDVNDPRVAGRDRYFARPMRAGRPVLNCVQLVPPSLDLKTPLPGISNEAPISHGAWRAAHSVA